MEGATSSPLSHQLRLLVEYLSLRPCSPHDFLTLARCAISSVMISAKNPASPLRVSENLPDRVRVRRDGLVMTARPHSDDLYCLLPSHKREVAKWFRPTKGQVVIDVGAHTGYYALRAASAGARVIAVEPNPSTFSILRSNVEANKPLDVRLVSSAIGSRAGTILLHISQIAPGISSVSKDWASKFSRTAESAVEVPVMTLDDLVSTHGVGRVDWLLIDVEGSELEVLEGARRTLRSTFVAIVEVSSAGTAGAVVKLMNQAGFIVADSGESNEVNRYMLFSRGPSMN